MDLETENRLAALLMEEARKARIQADKEGVHAYLQKPNVRARPNSRFLTATVLGVQQANRVVEVSEMWNAREKELELDTKLKRRSKSTNICNDQRSCHDSLCSCSSLSYKEGSRNSIKLSSQRIHEHFDTKNNGGLKDEEVEEFLYARAKRGRGAIGSRMDEPGPYVLGSFSGQAMVNSVMREKEEWEHRILGPEKPSFIKSKSPKDVRCTNGDGSENSKSKSTNDIRYTNGDGFENSKRHGSEDKDRKRRRKARRGKIKNRSIAIGSEEESDLKKRLKT